MPRNKAKLILCAVISLGFCAVLSGCLGQSDPVPAPKGTYTYHFKETNEIAQVEARREGDNMRFTVTYNLDKKYSYKRGIINVDAKNDVRNIHIIRNRLSFIYDPTPRTKAQSEKDIIIVKGCFLTRDKEETPPEGSRASIIKIHLSVGLWDAVNIEKVEFERRGLE